MTLMMVWMDLVAMTSAQRTEICPLLQTQWGQGNPYNLQCPIKSGKHCQTGCVATAMAQVMRYYEWPKNEFVWSLMRDSYDTNTSATDESVQSVAALMVACGTAVNMDYGVSTSAAWEGDAAMALPERFGYATSVHETFRNMYGRTAWENLIYHELSKGRPVIYGGMPSGFAHQFVCDGYNEGKFHFNMAWQFMPDGYYAVDALDRYPDGQTAIVGICLPNEAMNLVGEEFVWNGLRCKVTDKDEVWVCAIEKGATVSELTIPSSVEWQDRTFRVTGIDYSAFEDCTTLTHLTIPASVEVLGRRFVLGCQQLTDLSVEDDNPWYLVEDGVLRTATELLAYPMTKTTPTYRIPDGITDIPASLFRGNVWLERVEIPAAVTTIDILAFRGCTGLRTIVSENTTPRAIEDMAFDDDTYATATLIVPPGTTNKYKRLAGWKLFSHIEEATTDISVPSASTSSPHTRYQLNGTTAPTAEGITIDADKGRKYYLRRK